MFSRSPTEPPPLKVRKTTHVGPSYTARRPIYAPQTSGHSRRNRQSTLADDRQQPSPSTGNETESQPYVGSDATRDDGDAVVAPHWGHFRYRRNSSAKKGSSSRHSSSQGSNINSDDSKEGQVASGSTRRNKNVAYNAHKYKEDLIYFPKFEKSTKHGVFTPLKGKTEIPLFIVSRREITNNCTAEAPTAFSPPSAMRMPSVPPPSLPMSSVTTPTAHYEMSGEEWFNLMNPWAKYSVELNRPPNRPRSPPVVYDEPTPEISDYEDSSEEEYSYDVMDTGEESEMEVEEERMDEDGMRGVKRVREEGSDVDDPRHKKLPRM